MRKISARTHNTVVVLSALVPIVAGYFVGDLLAYSNRVQTFKLWNLWGIAYEIIGIFLLSGFILKSKGMQERVDFWGTPLVIAIALGIPTGAVLSTTFKAGGDLGQTFLYLFAAGFLVNMISASHDIPSRDNPEFRIKMLGPTCLVLGMLMQLFGAYLDLKSDL